ncbi:winged helix-turn-helix domain-containing protein [Agrilutibacter solisilvae]|uniref:Winged helix-turn-helix domain-containing protein n=1 Tax=Agrilutibacter solisilvae TaxID=2763317 RepID=A0A974Y1P2_9GAMM|nr:winged helix-turn-helix domain-containing protein [Lysobacter solisilvae]QSX79806.1 winged helix-turn-helix domain-containing protein [Lysobacter solisilvae]
MAEPLHPSWPAGTRLLQVDDVQIDLRYRRVVRPEHESELPQRMFDLLLLFLAEPHVLHSRADLFTRVWPGVIVEDANLSQSVWMLRKALGESRKHWIRTVSKSGYVFEPPQPVTAIEPAATVAPADTPTNKVTAGPTPLAPLAPDPTPASTPLAASDPSLPGASPAGASLPGMTAANPPAGAVTARPRRPRIAAWLATAALVILAVGGSALWLHRARAPAAATAQASPQLAIALIDVEDKAAPGDARWPVKVLHSWVGWKLESLPEITLMTEAHLAADARHLSPRIVFLSSGIDSRDPTRVFVRARFDEGGKEHSLEQKGTRAQLPQLIDALSLELLAKLVPARAHARWPALALDTATAQRYAEGLETLDRRDWVATSKILQDVTERAPRFGLARLQLATAYSRLARASAAIEQTRTAGELLQPAPKEVMALLKAEESARDPLRQANAAAAFGALARQYPAKTLYLINQARTLMHAGKLQEALAILNLPQWESEPVGYRLQRLLHLASIYMAMGDPARARDTARDAEALAAAAGKGWEQERGESMLLMAQADTFELQEKADFQAYERAAQQFELAGDDMDALYARFLLETEKPGNAPSTRLDTLLVQARERGYRQLEVEILRTVAYRHYREGDMDAYRARLEQALATALTLGNDDSRYVLELDLLNEDFLRGRFDSADRRLTSLRASGQQGDFAIWVAQFDAVVAMSRGQYTPAGKALAQAIALVGKPAAGEEPSAAAARLACMQADLDLVKGRLENARTQLKACGHQPSMQVQANLGEAVIELLAGDRDTAKKQIRDARTELAKTPDNNPDRWLVDLWVASQLTRVGEAAESDKLYLAVLPHVRKAGYGWLIALTETGLAENAATRGDWVKVRGHVAAARGQLAEDVWSLSNRLDVVLAVAALDEGQTGRALELMTSVHARAHRNGDTITQAEIHSLMPSGVELGECTGTRRSALVARTGLRGATLDWLVKPSKVDAPLLIAQHRIR